MGDSVSSLIRSSSSEPVLVAETGVGESPGDEEGKSVNLSSAEEAVEGLLGWLRCDLCRRGNRGVGESVMCGAVADRKETSLSDGTDTEADTSVDGERARWDVRVVGLADWSTTLLVASSIKN